MSLANLPLIGTPLAVIDLETTGLSPTHSKIVEIAVARVDDIGQPPRLVLDTLVDPQGRVSCSEIHGIYDEDVDGAPLLGELMRPIATAIDGAVVASFNVYFDMPFIEAAFEDRKLPLPVPHLCLMWMRPALGLGSRATLEATCSALGVPHQVEHRAATDAMAAALLWQKYVHAASERGITTFGELAGVKSYKYCKSWTAAPYAGVSESLKMCGTALKPRRAIPRSETERDAIRHAEYENERAADVPFQSISRAERSVAEYSEARTAQYQAQQQLTEYWEGLKGAITDLDISADEVRELKRLQQAPALTPDAIRYAHAQLMSGLLADLSKDLRIDESEVAWISDVTALLRDLGWAPGDPIAPIASAEVEGRALPSAKSPLADVPAPRFSGLQQDRGWWGKLFGG